MIAAFSESLHKVNDSLLRYHLAVDTYTLTEIYKVRGGIESDAVALALKDCCDHVGGASFAVSAPYVDAFESRVRMAEI